MLTLGSPRIDVKAIVATYGNAALSQTKNNLLTILDFFKRRLLLGAGSKGPLKGDPIQARQVHGLDGLGGLSRRHKGYLFEDGIELIVDSAISRRIDTIIATGPLTDLARAIKKDSRVLKKIDEIVIMGGALFVKGNVTPYSEFNFYCDPKAASIVLNADVRKRLISLDVTHKTALTARRLSPIKRQDTAIARFICSAAEYSISVNERRGFKGAPMHDPLAVGLAIKGDIGEYEDLCLDVETEGEKRGRVVVKKGRPNTKFCKRVDAERFFELFLGTLEKLSKKE